MFEEVDSVVFDRTIVQGFDGDDGKLRAGFLFEFRAECFEALPRALRDHPGQIGDVSGGGNFRDVVGGGSVDAKNCQNENAKE